MKKFLAIFCFLFSTSAFAEWVPISKSSETGDSFYIDYSTFKRINGYIRVWILTDTIKPNNFGSYSSKELLEIDCIQTRLRVINFISYTSNMGAGRVNNSTSRVSDWDFASPGDINSLIIRKTCTR